MTHRSVLAALFSLFILAFGASSAFAAPTQKGTPYVRMDKDQAVVLLVDHQTGLFSLVQDFEPMEFKNNILALGATAKHFNVPVVLSTSLKDGPNGPLLPEIRAMFPEAPLIERHGQINAWDNEDFRKAVEQTGRKQVIIAGIVTDVCVSCLSLSMAEAGYDVFVVVDASGTFNEAVRHAAWDRMSANGIQLVNWFTVACELQRDWRNDMEGLANILHQYMPAYGNLIDSQNHTNSNN